MISTDEYRDIFSKYRSLLKLRNVDGNLTFTSDVIDKLFISQINLDEIEKYFEYFEIIKLIDLSLE